jgi:hypothetical protein
MRGSKKGESILKKIVLFALLSILSITQVVFCQVMGDANNSATVDIIDALLTAQYYVGFALSGFNASNADVDCNGSTDIIDALQIAKYYVGILSQFPCSNASSGLFCKFRWGMNWGSGTLPQSIDLVSIWVGYETDDGMNQAVHDMLLDAKGRANVTPVYYAYFIPFKANIRAGLGDCNTDADGHNLCNEGAQWIRTNRSYIMTVYDTYARLTADLWGTQRPIIWLIEPDFIQYTYATQTNPFTRQEIADLASQIIDTVKARLPNAIISLFHATWTYNVAEYWSHFNLAKIDMINITGMADQNGYFNDGDAYNRAEATYAFLHATTGKPILADTSFGVTNQNDTWSDAQTSTLNSMIGDGVFAVIIEPPPSTYEQQIAALNPSLLSPCK